MPTFPNVSQTATVLASNVLGQFNTKQYGTGSVTNDVLAGGITIDKLAGLGSVGQLAQSTGGGEIGITPPKIFSNIDESGLVAGGIVYGDSISGYSVVPINPMVASYITSRRVAPIVTLTLTSSYSFVQPHGLGSAPFSFRAVLVCNSTDMGYNSGAEIQLDNTGTNGITVGYDATNVFAYTSSSCVIKIVRVSDNSPQTLTLANWYIKFYLSL
jgi:hypothetical protein